MKFKLTWRVWILVIVLALSLLSIFVTPSFLQKGVIIKSVEDNSTASDFGLIKGQLIQSINGKTIESLEDYSKIIQENFPSKGDIKLSIKTKESEIIYYSNHSPEITISKAPLTNLKTGLDLAGGSRALIQAENHELTTQETQDLAAILNQRLNVYGIEDVDVSTVIDLQGNNRIKIEIAGATPEDIKELVSKQGKFEAKIGNQTVFSGGDKDITSVARNPPNAIIESCNEYQGQQVCNFRFAIYLSEAAAKRHAEITDKVPINETNPQYLSKKLDLYLDNKKVDSLFIGEGLKGRQTTQISISGSGSGKTREDAYKDTQEEMKHLQTVLITGSLPYKLEIVKLDTISPNLGNQFTNSIFLAAFSALIVVTIIVFIRYKTFKSSISLLFTSIAEILIVLGVASLIEWNLDLPSIAGILVTMGTGIDQQIIILDEARQKVSVNMKQKLKRALSIIIGSYFTALVAMFPLMWAGAGLLKGFAITTIIGLTVGVLITRPAYSDIVKKIEE